MLNGDSNANGKKKGPISKTTEQTTLHVQHTCAHFLGGSVKCRLPTDCGLLFLGLENNRTIVVTFSFAW